MSTPKSSGSLLKRIARRQIEDDPDLAQRVAAQEAAARIVVVPDPAAFIPTLTIEEPQGRNDVRLVPFNLWPAQAEALDTLLTEDRVVILKARQLGITWLILAMDAWDCWHHPGVVILYFSKGLPEAQELIKRVKGMYHRYQGPKPRLITDNKGELEWSNGSRMLSLAATETAGRSFTASKIRLDEFAHMQFPQQVYSAVKPTVDGGGQIIVLSTANGEDDPFHTVWSAAAKGESTFTPLFLPWSARPDRTPEWYARVASDAFSMAEMKREYPATPEEAFSEVTAERFLEHISIWDACKEDLPPLTDREPLVWAVDAGVSNDTFAAVATSRHPLRRDDVAVRIVLQWTPAKGEKLDFIAIAREIIAHMRRWYSVVFVYDSYQMHLMAQQIEAAGFWVEEFSQAGARLVADRQLRDLVLGRRLAHDGNAALRQAIDNADRKISEDKKTLRIVKRSAAKKIDPLIALSMSAAKCLELNL